ncbi:MAG TPA: hypothetical protein DEA78_12530 [Cyanobacteria bacterium UBA11159]|nr:hypothetical protein [Cyanobacteria bacterium UBA11367]HBE60694.1 hypothetical protein [Cyanobacteria bacterium UBA11366]HBK66440.1 hypothetical protein [Cyanobacteria bacterium UBA11166]HBR74508.1 hypothetical protein [Cyanobacteria bacterium UBA11159]HBS68306.1 hypothetical protein [Cyanobacteria bacterium UBA11153]
MSALNRNTCRRLKKLQQIPSVWEGDRRPLLGFGEDEEDSDGSSECILWVDGSEGIVRAMDVVPQEMGPEATVRTLLRSMEHPQSPARPARPAKIVVRDRELQFFLRGVLQELEITIDYVPELPLIDELFRGFEEVALLRQPKLPPQYADILIAKAYDIWQIEPWESLADHQILAIELNRWDTETLYVSVMGMLGMEYGVLLYRSIDSLKRFRASVLAQESLAAMEQAFLAQDCLFITYGRADENSDRVDSDSEDMDLADLPISAIAPNFGTVHPLEGMRPFLYEEEALVIYIALESLHRFFRTCYRQLADDTLPDISKRYRIPVPLEPELKPTVSVKSDRLEPESKSTISVKVTTLPELSAELLEMVEMAEQEDLDDEDEDEDDFEEMSPPLRDDLVPKDAFLSLGMITWEMVESLRSGVDFYQSIDVQATGEGLPVVLIQTTRPKAKSLIEQLKIAGGIKCIGFNPGEDPSIGDRYDLGILQTEDSSLYLFGEFPEADPTHIAARKKWDQRCKKNKGYCALIVAKGLTGASRGNPQPNDMMAMFEARSISTKELGLGLLQLMPVFDLE